MQLLVSVRSALEAEAALEGGADVIDVKEPSRGSLGRADDAVIAEVVRTVAGRRIVTAAMGELVEGERPCSVAGLTWIKWGLAGTARLDWRAALRRLRLATPKAGLVAVAYADAERASSPSVEDVCALACDDEMPVLLLDTWRKDGASLFDWLSEPRLLYVCERCRRAGVRLALAGSLRLEHLFQARQLDASVLAVRGAVCVAESREAHVDPGRVRAFSLALANGER